MDLFESLSGEREDRALDRLETMLAAYLAESAIEQDLALERARTYCEREWGGYEAGLDALARRVESRGGDAPEVVMAVLRLREEATQPGAMIGAIRAERVRAAGRGAEYAAIIARYGSEDRAKSPTEFESRFVDACRPLAPEGEADDPLAPLCGWQLAWHPVPAELAGVVSAAYRLPGSVMAAKAETEAWDSRLRELEILFDCHGNGALPTACAARRKVVDDLWRSEIPATTAADFAARLDYWADRGGDDGTGYAVLRRDLALLGGAVAPAAAPASTKDRARGLKAAHPDWSLARIGKELGISRQAVHKHLKGFTQPV